VAAVLLAFRLAVWPPWGSTVDHAALGFGLIALVAALHMLALLPPGRYAVESAAWIATVVGAFVLIVLLLPAGGD
jgi:hypothetical protein